MQTGLTFLASRPDGVAFARQADVVFHCLPGRWPRLSRRYSRFDRVSVAVGGA